MPLQGLKISRKSQKPVSDQIASFVKSKIYRRELKAGSKLPTTQDMMQQLGVGTNTIRQAMQSLKEEGLVRPVPRLGTIVNELDEVAITEGNIRSKVRVIAVAGLMQSVGEKVKRFRHETAEGIFGECDRIGATMVILPLADLALKAEALYDRLASLGCQGLIYRDTSTHLEDDTIDYLGMRGIQAVTSRRMRCHDGRSCIESDFDSAGYEVGLYYYSQDCEKTVVFAHYELTVKQSEAKSNGYPLGLKHGIYRAYESKGLLPDIEFYVNEGEVEPDTSKSILAKLETLAPNSGVVFTNGYQFMNLFKRFPHQAKKLLLDKKVTILSNKTINVELEPLVAGLEFMVVLDQFEDIGRQMVGMLNGIVEGHLPRNSTMLSELKLMSFKDAMGRN